MQRASQAFTPQDRERINQAVQQAESVTSAEIVPVVASASGRYDRPEDLVGLYLALAALVIVWFAFPTAQDEHGSWEAVWPHWKLLAMLAATVLAFVVGAAVATHVGPLRRLFTSRTQMADEVAARARELFYSQAIHHTAGQTGLLIYVSLYERMAAVLGDQTVMEKLGQTSLDELRDTLLDGLRGGKVTDAFCRTIQAAGQRLAPVLPRQANDANELPDALVTLD
ncbi:MAG: TPM domain-containing protein [Pirellulaceae bacterium]